MTIKLVQGDTLPYIYLTLTDKVTGQPIDLSGPEVKVNLHFRATDSTTGTVIIPCIKTNGGADGGVKFSFPHGTLDGAPGDYEGEVEIDFDGEIQTIYQTLKFVLREQFA